MNITIWKEVMLMDIVVKKNGLKNYKMNIIDNVEKIIYN